MGPLINEQAVEEMAKGPGPGAERRRQNPLWRRTARWAGVSGRCYVRPCLIAAPHDLKIVHEETFAPILTLFLIRAWRKPSPGTMKWPQGP